MKNYYKLSHPQKRILMTQLLYEDSPVGNIGGYVSFHGAVDIHRLRDALDHTIRAMDALRLRITFHNNDYVQYVTEEKDAIEIVDLSKASDKELAVEGLAKEMMEKPFDLLEHQLFRITMFSDLSEYSGYILCMHHIIMDGWSVQLFADSVCKYYNNEDEELGSYLTFVEKEQEYLDSERAQKDKKYWEEFTRKHNLYDSNGERNSSGVREVFPIAGETKNRLDQLADLYKGGNVVLTACFFLLDHYRGGTHIIDLPNFNRTNRGFRRTGGMFTSTVLTAIEIDENLTLASFIKEVRIRMFEGYRHQMWPFDLMNIDSNSEPFRYSVNYYNTDLSQKIGNISGDYHEIYPGVQAIPLQIILKTWGTACEITFDMRKDYYLEGDGEAFYLFFKKFMDDLYETPELTIGEWIERRKSEYLQEQMQSLAIERNTCRYLEEFLYQAFTDIQTEDVAIYTENAFVLRSELLRYISGAVDELKKAGICSENKLLICLHNSLEYVAYVYAAVFMGVTFIPVDPEYSDPQIQYIFENSQSTCVITNKVFDAIPCRKPVLMKGNPILPKAMDESKPAYILYTSGTTGNPKGVLISRKAITAYLRWASELYGTETFFVYSSPSFDLSITALFLPVIKKGSMVIVKLEHANFYHISSLPVAEKITAMKGTPSNFSLLLKHDTSKLNLRVIICGGEELTVSLAQELRKRFGKECRIYNEYGPTECTVGCMCYQYQGETEGKAVLIGKAAPGTNVFILDKNYNLCISGKSGEIFLAGDQLATDYWQLSEENRKSFFYHEMLGKRVYKTGDFARYTKNGDVEYLGRTGRQCKIHGFRVELDGIERFLKALPFVNNAAVWVYHDQLIAAVESSVCTENELTDEIVKVLPQYCVPHIYLILESIPCTLNGKVDYRSLEQSLDKNRLFYQKSHKAYTEETFLEEKRQLLETVLRETFHYTDRMESFNYFLEGGDSITALRLIASVEQKGFYISLADILDHPDFMEMVSCLRLANGGLSVENPMTEIALPKHLQYFSSTCDDFMKYRQINVLKINRILSSEELSSLINYLINRYPALGMEYMDGVLKKTANSLKVHMEYMDQKEREQQIVSWIQKQVNEKVLFCMDALIGKNVSILRFNVHHMLVDGTSWYQLIQATSDYFHSVKEESTKYLNYLQMQNRLQYSWEPYAYFDCGAGEPAPKGYTQFSTAFDVSGEIAEMGIVNGIKEAIFSIDRYRDYSLLLDRNGRTFIEEYQNEGLGCYSILIPVMNSFKTAEQQIQEQIQNGKIHIPEKQCIRVNYMGHIEELFKATGFDESIPYLKISIAENLKKCSGYGCDFEITAWISNGGEIEVFLTGRTSLIHANDAEEIFKVLQEKLQEVGKENMFWNEDEELQILEEIEEDFF